MACMRDTLIRIQKIHKLKGWRKINHAEANWKKPSVVIRKRQDETKQGIAC